MSLAVKWPCTKRRSALAGLPIGVYCSSRSSSPSPRQVHQAGAQDGRQRHRQQQEDPGGARPPSAQPLEGPRDSARLQAVGAAAGPAGRRGLRPRSPAGARAALGRRPAALRAPVLARRERPAPGQALRGPLSPRRPWAWAQALVLPPAPAPAQGAAFEDSGSFPGRKPTFSRGRSERAAYRATLSTLNGFLPFQRVCLTPGCSRRCWPASAVTRFR